MPHQIMFHDYVVHLVAVLESVLPVPGTVLHAVIDLACCTGRAS